MTDDNKLPRSRESIRPPRARLSAATWFIIAATLLGLLAVLVLLYDAIMRL